MSGDEKIENNEGDFKGGKKKVVRMLFLCFFLLLLLLCIHDLIPEEEVSKMLEHRRFIVSERQIASQ